MDVESRFPLVDLICCDVPLSLHGPHRWQYFMVLWDTMSWYQLSVFLVNVIVHLRYDGLNEIWCVCLLHRLVQIHCVLICSNEKCDWISYIYLLLCIFMQHEDQ